MKKILFILGLLFLFSGCAQKEIRVVTQYKKIPCHYPYLKQYDVNETLKLQVKKKDNKICIRSWKACIPEKEFYKLVKYIKTLKTSNKLYYREIELYNKQYGEEK